MRDVYDVLREKELELNRVRQEIDALRSILPLLADDADEDTSSPSPIYSPLHAVNHD